MNSTLQVITESNGSIYFNGAFYSDLWLMVQIYGNPDGDLGP